MAKNLASNPIDDAVKRYLRERYPGIENDTIGYRYIRHYSDELASLSVDLLVDANEVKPAEEEKEQSNE